MHILLGQVIVHGEENFKLKTIKSMKKIALSLLIFAGIALANPNSYDFKIGHWNIDAKTMNPNMSHSLGKGTGYVFKNQVGLLQDNLCISMNGVSNVIGTTMRTWDVDSKIWYVRWLAHGQSSGIGSGTGKLEDGVVVETFEGQDSKGKFKDQMHFTLHSKDHYTANLIRTYLNGGPTLDCIWCYEAKRSKSNVDKKCWLLEEEK